MDEPDDEIGNIAGFAINPIKPGSWKFSVFLHTKYYVGRNCAHAHGTRIRTFANSFSNSNSKWRQHQLGKEKNSNPNHPRNALTQLTTLDYLRYQQTRHLKIKLITAQTDHWIYCKRIKSVCVTNHDHLRQRALTTTTVYTQKDTVFDNG